MVEVRSSTLKSIINVFLLNFYRISLFSSPGSNLNVLSSKVGPNLRVRIDLDVDGASPQDNYVMLIILHEQL